MSRSVADELEDAEKHLNLAIAKLLPLAGSAHLTPSGRKWISSWSDVRKMVRVMLALRMLAGRARSFETPRQKKTRPVCS